MRTDANRRRAKLEKRTQIERELHQIILSDSREILLDNLRRRRRHEFNVGDIVTVVEWISGGYGKDNDLDRRIYRVTEGRVIQVTPGGYFIEGLSTRGKPARDFINRAHIINGLVRLGLKH